MDKNDVLIRKIEELKRSEYKATAIKVELEAQLGRRYCRGGDGGCTDCDGNGRIECGECDGNWEGGRCDNLCDEGYIRCERECNDGFILNEDDEDERCPDMCDGGWFDCEECYENGYYSNCDYCYEGYNDCEGCDGDGSGGSWNSTERCHNWIMERLSEHGLAELREETFHLSHGISTNWHPTGALRYAEFYNDGSVDSEFTFTLSLEQAESVLLLPKFIEIFNALAEEMGAEIDVRGAGMHMAFLNNLDCEYPSHHINAYDEIRFTNFRRSMALLLPALYFLGSSNDSSRGLNFRRPEIGAGTHRSAIDWRNGAVEFRVFNTCYDTPEAILDNVVVMANAMKFWCKQYRRHSLSKVCASVRFGNEISDKLDRFYVEANHIDLLNKGLNLLKPSYYTITELKQQRKFKKTKATVKSLPRKLHKDAVVSYREYENRFEMTTEVRRLRTLASYIEDAYEQLPAQDRLRVTREQIEADVLPQVEEYVANFKKDKKPLELYIEERVKAGMRELRGQFIIAEES